MRKTVIMNISQTIKKISQTAKLKVIGIKEFNGARAVSVSLHYP